MGIVNAKCPECGEITEVDEKIEASVCRICGAAFLTGKAVNAYKESVQGEWGHVDIPATNTIENTAESASTTDRHGNEISSITLGGYTLTNAQVESLKKEILDDRKIMAIKLFRDYTGAGLAEAKNAVEEYEAQLNNGGFTSSSSAFSNTVSGATSSNNNSMQEGQKKGGCYIATAVYGSYDCPEVWTLRRYRDDRLAKSFGGRLFIRTYYAISPKLVKLFGNNRLFINVWRKRLDKMVLKLNGKGYESTPYVDR